MKPFNLEAALAGAKVITCDGMAVTQLVKFESDSRYCIAGVVDREVQVWDERGNHFAEYDVPRDLFMASTTREVWIARYGSVLRVDDLCDSLHECLERHPHADGHHRIEWEE